MDLSYLRRKVMDLSYLRRKSPTYVLIAIVAIVVLAVVRLVLGH
jgi:hypothetical protein